MVKLTVEFYAVVYYRAVKKKKKKNKGAPRQCCPIEIFATIKVFYYLHYPLQYLLALCGY